MPSPILHQSSWARSALGNPIPLLSCIGDGTERPLLFIGGVHGDEPEGVELAERFAEWLQKNHNVPMHPWILIPCLNVDGYKKNERTNGRGVDLNRNFPSADWTSETRAPRYSPGVNPGSEPEVQALCQLIQETNPKVIFHFHSWNPCVVYSGAEGKVWAEKAGRGIGYDIREEIGYPTPGSLGQYGLLNLKTPVICIEEQEGCDLKTIWPRFGENMKSLVLK